MSSDVSSSAGNTSGSGPYIPPQGTGDDTSTGNVSGVQAPPPISQTESIDNLVFQTFNEQNNAQSPDASNPKILQPEIQQAILSNSDALKFMLMNNMMQIFASNGNDNTQNVELTGKLYGMDESMLHRMSQQGFDFSTAHEISSAFNAKVNDIISNMWDKFNEVIEDLKQRDQEWLKSGAKQYLDYVKSGEFQAKTELNTSAPDEKVKVNQGAAQYQAFLDSIPTGDKERILDRFNSNNLSTEIASNYLKSENVAAFGKAFQETTPDELNTNNTKILLATVMTNAGGIMSHDIDATRVNTDQVAYNMIRDGFSNASNALPIVGFDSNTAATLGYLGAMLASSAMVLSSFESVLSSKSQGKSAHNDAADQDFAQRYAHNLSNFVNSKGFEAGVVAIVTQRCGTTNQLDNDQKTDIVNRLRVLMLSNALAMVHNADPQNSVMNGAAWRNAIENPNALKDDPVNGDITYSLARDINTYLPSDPVARENTLSYLESFYDTSTADKASINKDLLETNNAIKGAFVEPLPLPAISEK